MTIWVDADSCAKRAREHIIKYSSLFSVPVIFVANKTLSSESNFPFQMIVTSQTKDSADNYIIENSTSSDLIITKDILFAERAIKKNVSVMSDKGFVFTKENILEQIEERNYNLSLAEIGFTSSKKSDYSKKDFVAFVKSFEKIFQILRKQK